MTADQLKKRTKAFGVAVIKLARALPTDRVTIIIVQQLVRSATSVGANYRSSCRAKSRRDFISKMTTAEEEADETQYWLEVLVESEMVRTQAVAALCDEADQLVRILVASIKTARKRMARIRNPQSAIRIRYNRGVFTTTNAGGERVFDAEGWESAIQQVLAACKAFHVPCGYPANANDIEMRMQQGFSVCVMNWGEAGFKTIELGRAAADRQQ